MLLEPDEAFAELMEYDMSGLRLIGEGADFRTFRVVSVAEASPASVADIRPGDALASLDGRPAAELTLSEIRERFRKEGKLPLTVERGGARLELVLELRRRL
jgi:C-terminal processing protease CtpA/Prc